MYVLLNPRLAGDSVIGNVKFSKRRGTEGDSARVSVHYVTRRISIGTIDKIAVSKINPLKVAGWTIVGLGSLIAAACLGGNCNMNMGGLGMNGWGGSWSYTP